jgi:hypothetical protein
VVGLEDLAVVSDVLAVVSRVLLINVGVDMRRCVGEGVDIE